MSDRPIRILVLDDEEQIRELLGLSFQRKAITIDEAGSGEEALEKTKQIRFDGALVDKNLPGMSGLDFIRHVREKDRRMAIIMMTGYASPQTAIEALNLDVDAYLEKPFPSINTPVERLLKAIESRAAFFPRKPAAPAARGPEPAASTVEISEVLPVVAAPVASSASAAVAAVPAPEVMTERDLRVVVIAARGALENLSETLGPSDRMLYASKESELMKAIGDPADVVVLDSSFIGEVIPIVERVRKTSPNAEILVLYERALDLRTVQKLIDFGVRKLLQLGTAMRAMRTALDAARSRPR